MHYYLAQSSNFQVASLLLHTLVFLDMQCKPLGLSAARVPRW